MTVTDATRNLQDQLVETNVQRPLSERHDIAQAVRDIARALTGRRSA